MTTGNDAEAQESREVAQPQRPGDENRGALAGRPGVVGGVPRDCSARSATPCASAAPEAADHGPTG
jgi:hypothetical protein